ncbi:MAG: DUF3570 domain-containing protein [Proteobacteria bacterium]|nr:MAG: DUF3570 domain-containing protein [Pseudomonadota bacterium]
MQLKPREVKSLKLALTAATATLLSCGSVAQAVEAKSPTEMPNGTAEFQSPEQSLDHANLGFFSRSYDSVKNWAKYSGEVGLLYYGEVGRVRAVEPSVLLTAQFSGDRKWTNHLTIDTLTGASPNGAVPSRNAQTFTGPSGNSSYVSVPGEAPVDKSFHDTRFAYSTAWSQPVGERYEYSVGGGLSSEYDFSSLSVNASGSRYFNTKNTKLSVGASLELDSSDPVGGAPVGFSTMAGKSVKSGAQSKTVSDFLVGVSQVISRRLIMQTNYSFGKSSGYMNDPYKIISEVTPDGSPTAGDVTGTNFYETRPDARSKNSVYVSAKYHLISAGIVTGAYRYFWDSWGMTSHTLSAEYEIPVTVKWRVGADVRYYKQNRADFYRAFVVQGQALPSFASSDYRLGDMDAYTLGLKLSKKINNERNDISLHLQYYEQVPDTKAAGAFGSLAGLEIAPTVKALMAKVICSF